MTIRVRPVTPRMRLAAACCAVFFLVVALVATVQTVMAQTPTGSGYFSDGNLGASISDALPGGRPPAPAPAASSGGGGSSSPPPAPSRGGGGGSSNTGGGGGGGGAPSPYETKRNYWGGTDGSGPGYMNNAPFMCPAGSAPNARPYTDVQIDRSTGMEVSRRNGCEGPAAPAAPGTTRPAAAAAPSPTSPPVTEPPPPPPPTADELANVVPLPDPAWGVWPGTEGVTGLGTAVWDPNGADSRSVGVSIRGWSVTVSARPSRWEWNMAAAGPASTRNPDPIVVSSWPGADRSNPAGTYTYETVGDYTLTLTVTWAGSFTFSREGVPAETRSLGTQSRSTSRPYHVYEIRSVGQTAHVVAPV